MNKNAKWSIDPTHSEIGFKIRHLMIAHLKGSFKKYDASIYTTHEDFLTAEIDVWIDVASISTGDESRDQHLKGSEFFDVENHPQITFTANTIERADKEKQHELWGNLTIKGITKHIQLNVEFGGLALDPHGNEKAGFVITGKISRNDFGLTWNASMESGGVLVSDEVSILCEVELVNISEKDLKMEIDMNQTK